MFSGRSRDTLRLRKQLLLLEGELNRAALRDDLRRLREVATWASPVSAWFRSGSAPGGGSWVARVAPVAGLLASAALRPGPVWVRRGLRLVQLAVAAYPLWKALTSRPAADTAASPAGRPQRR
ncbi:MAG: hypothetical protein KF791_11035 [Verrucomicrobiae bacterium]|nr:hypothetical protein [Verrucomicrobiae bacterium]